jgi:hypothetical protein
MAKSSLGAGLIAQMMLATGFSRSPWPAINGVFLSLVRFSWLMVTDPFSGSVVVHMKLRIVVEATA